MKSNILEPSDESFKCDSSSWHNRLEGNKTSKTTWKFCSKSCERRFHENVRRHRWESPGQAPLDTPKIFHKLGSQTQ